MEGQGFISGTKRKLHYIPANKHDDFFRACLTQRLGWARCATFDVQDMLLAQPTVVPLTLQWLAELRSNCQQHAVISTKL